MHLNDAVGMCVGPINNDGRVPISVRGDAVVKLVRPDNIERDHVRLMRDLSTRHNHDWGNTPVGGTEKQLRDLTPEQREKWMVLSSKREWLLKMAEYKFGAVFNGKSWPMVDMLERTQWRDLGGACHFFFVLPELR